MYPDTDSGLYLLENERQWSADRNSANPQFRRAYIACGRNPENTAPVLEQSARLDDGFRKCASIVIAAQGSGAVRRCSARVHWALRRALRFRLLLQRRRNHQLRLLKQGPVKTQMTVLIKARMYLATLVVIDD